jgi:serine protease
MPVADQESELRVAVRLLAALTLAAAAPRLAWPQNASASAQTGAMILKVKRGTSSAALQKLLQQMGATLHRRSSTMSAVVLRMPAGMSTASFKGSLHASGIVEYVEPEVRMYAFGAPNDPNFSKQWGLQDSGYGIHAPSAWSGSTGRGITVAVVDTGIRRDCPDLQGTQILQGYNAITNGSDPTDDNGHGTHVSGTIAQTTNNNFGCAGVAYEASLLPVKVLGSDGSGSNFDVAEGIRWAADHGARVINMSLGGAGGSTLQDAVRYATAKGVVICAAAGNGGGGSLSYPAAYPETISVGAIQSNGQKASFSQYGNGLSVMAPGVNILQQTWDPQKGQFYFGSWAGTSMATPHVSGTAALVLSRNSSLTPAQVKDILQRTARDLGPSGWDSETGYGLIDAAAAVNAAGGGSNPSPSPTPTPSDPSYNIAVTQIQAPSSAPLNSTVAVTVQVQNKGNTTVDARVTLTEGPAGDAPGGSTVRVAPGETSSANLSWASGSSPGSHSLRAAAEIVGHTDADPSDNSRLATIDVSSGNGNTPNPGPSPSPSPSPGTTLRLRVYTYYSAYRVGGTAAIRHIVETSDGQRVPGVTIQGTITAANGRTLSYRGTTGSQGTFNAGLRLTGGGGTGTYSVQATATSPDSATASTTYSFQVVR